MAGFINLEDSPMFQKRLCSLEDTADELRDRCQKLYKGGKKFTDTLGVACNGDTAFADSLEEFGGGQDDPVSVSIGGPVISKFINAFRELATYKELLRSQVEHVLIDRLMQFLNVDLQDAKESRRRFDKSIHAYDQAREKVVSLKKNTRDDIVAGLEEELQNSKSAFERSRFNLVSALTNVEAKKKYEFLESISAIMDAHLRYFKLGYDLLSQIEPYIHQVQTIKQGYLLKRSSSLRGDWKRRFFVLDSQGTLYYYRNKSTKPVGSLHHFSGSAEQNAGVFSRFRTRHNRSSSLNEETLGCRTVDLRTSAIKTDAEDSNLRLCFRIISPMKTYTLQAETEGDRMDWINKLTVVIASLLNYLQQPNPQTKHLEKVNSASNYDGRSLNSLSLENDITTKPESVSAILRQIPGNDLCAECNAPEPDWASLNLGILLCIECSGVHRNLGVHISKVRSLTLDVKVWEPTILDLFGAFGNAYCNSIWEGSLLEDGRVIKSNAVPSIKKPCPKDAISHKELYIHAKYVEKVVVLEDKNASGTPSYSTRIWQAVKTQNLKEVYRLIVISNTSIINTTFDEVVGVELYHHIDDAQDSEQDCLKEKRKSNDPTFCQRIKDPNDPGICLQGCSLLHLACQCGNAVMIELLIQFGADINMRDFHGRTPLHHCISTGNNVSAKHLLRRGARPSIKDGGGLSALERAMEMGAITDEELFIMLSES